MHPEIILTPDDREWFSEPHAFQELHTEADSLIVYCLREDDVHSYVRRYIDELHLIRVDDTIPETGERV